MGIIWVLFTNYGSNKRENYLFRCECERCVEQANDPDVTSDEDLDEEDDEDSYEDIDDDDDDEAGKDQEME